VDFGGQRRDIDRGVGQRCQHVTNIVGPDGRKVALQIDDDLDLAAGIELAQRLVNPVRSGGVIGAGHDRLEAMGGHRHQQCRRIGGDGDTADSRGLGAAQHMDDHRQAGDIQ
jgi:hypothetical protein